MLCTFWFCFFRWSYLCCYALVNLKELNNNTKFNNSDGPRNSINYVSDFCDEINVFSSSPNEQVKWEKERDLYQSNISISLAHKPLQEEIKRRILEKDYVAYQRRDKQVQPQPQEPPTQPGAPIPQLQMAQDLQP